MKSQFGNVFNNERTIANVMFAMVPSFSRDQHRKQGSKQHKSRDQHRKTTDREERTIVMSSLTGLDSSL